MYVDRHAGRGGIKPGSLSIAIAVNGAVVAALLFSAPEVFERPPPDGPLVIHNIPIIDPPPPELPKPHPKTVQPDQHIYVPTPPVPVPAPTIDLTTITEPPTFPPVPTPGTGTLVVPDPPAPAVPLLVSPAVDQRYLSALQPPYPPEETRAEHEGRVELSVLVGTDGRVKEVRRVSATSEAFFRVTRQQALSKWRFRPGTRDGVPIEAWYKMAVSFRLES